LNWEENKAIYLILSIDLIKSSSFLINLLARKINIKQIIGINNLVKELKDSETTNSIVIIKE
tara:strand:+ start:733 stop:918 length:186 start_codon:yes stop_codon:yes gene_type:complete